MICTTPVTTPLVRPWSYGLTYQTLRTVPPAELPVSVEFVRDSVLRSPNSVNTVEDEYIRRLIVAATRKAEQVTQRALVPQTWTLATNGWPEVRFELPRPPLISVLSVGYVDEDGATQTIDAAEYVVTASGNYSLATVAIASGGSWPTTATARADAVTVTYRAGYATGESPEAFDPSDPEVELIVQGICLFVGELYKQRSLSVQEPNNTAAQLQLDAFWRPVRFL